MPLASNFPVARRADDRARAAQRIKFGETIREALQREPQRPAAFVGLESLPQRFELFPADVQQVKDFIVEMTESDR